MRLLIDDLPDVDASLERLARSVTEEGGLLRLPLGLDRDGFLRFCERHPEVVAELDADGTVELMSPQHPRSSEYDGIVYAKLFQWWEQTRLGKVYNSSGGWALPSGAVRAPDAAWVSDAQIASTPDEEWDRFARVVPPFVAEVRSRSDRRVRLEAKMVDTWLAAGVELAWLLDPVEGRATVYRPGAEPQEHDNLAGSLSGGELLPGFTFALAYLR